MNKFRIGTDGRTAYEKITSHACKVAQVGFAEVVDFKFEAEKTIGIKLTANFMWAFSWAMADGQRNILSLRTVKYINAVQFDDVLMK